eukprot:365700-Chlamydomonas_euryale.AAC.5
MPGSCGLAGVPVAGGKQPYGVSRSLLGARVDRFWTGHFTLDRASQARLIPGTQVGVPHARHRAQA